MYLHLNSYYCCTGFYSVRALTFTYMPFFIMFGRFNIIAYNEINNNCRNNNAIIVIFLLYFYLCPPGSWLTEIISSFSFMKLKMLMCICSVDLRA